MTAAIFTSNLKKSYGQKEVLKGISLTVDPGTICALLGTNGAQDDDGAHPYDTDRSGCGPGGHHGA